MHRLAPPLSSILQEVPGDALQFLAQTGSLLGLIFRTNPQCFDLRRPLLLGRGCREALLVLLSLTPGQGAAPLANGFLFPGQRLMPRFEASRFRP